MIDFRWAVGRPFSNTKNLKIGIILGAIPIVNILTVLGYGMNSVKGAAEKKALPKWENIVDHITKSIIGIITGSIYMLPAFIVAYLFTGFKLQMIIFDQTIDLVTFGFVKGGIVGLFLAFILAVIAAYLLPLALMRYVLKNKFSEAFALSKLVKRALNTDYFVAWIEAVIYLLIILFIFGVLSGAVVVGALYFGVILAALLLGLAMYMSSIIIFSIIGQLNID